LLKISRPFSRLEPAIRDAALTGAELPDPPAPAELDGGDELPLQAAIMSAVALAAATAELTRNSDIFVIESLHSAVSCRL
jgi:hypothetical protein